MVGHSREEPQVDLSTDRPSLQLSTSICMPFNPYRQFRHPDHLNRPRAPMQMPLKQARPQPARAISYDASFANVTYKPFFNSTRAPVSATTEDVYISSPLTTTCTPDSFNVGTSYFRSSQSPETADSADMWGATFDFGNLNGKQVANGDFGLGLGPLGPEPASAPLLGEEAGHFPYSSLSAEIEPLTFDPGSPDGQSWSSLSDASAGLASDMAEFSPESNGTSLDLGLTADIDAFFGSGHSTPSGPQYTAVPATSHSRAESAPRHSYRTSPYPMHLGRGRSSSTGSVALSRTQRASTYIQKIQHTPDSTSQLSSPLVETNSIATFEDNEFQLFCQPHQSYSAENRFGYVSDGFSNTGIDTFEGQAQRSPELANILQSSGPDKRLCEHHFAGSTSPPDLFGPLSEEPSSPPPEDFDCEESMMPRAQDLRFEGDMYTPRYVRGHGNKREGWCGTCKPGRWLVLKNSAFWYDKSFSHGISAATGSPFEGPRETRRMKGNPDVWEGLCGSCSEWIALISSKKKGTTWFRHAYKCHTHQKVKDTTKRRREVTQGRAPKSSKTSSIKNESREETPFPLESGLTPLDEAGELENHGQEDTGSGLRAGPA
ncbi:MAG: hypothetical protein Q9219_003094 [cf. Caloplaca sp. 3 TL-2023]